jgi:hypothetical protein
LSRTTEPGGSLIGSTSMYSEPGADGISHNGVSRQRDRHHGTMFVRCCDRDSRGTSTGAPDRAAFFGGSMTAYDLRYFVG